MRDGLQTDMYSPFKKGGDKGAVPVRGTSPGRLLLAVWAGNLAEVERLVADPTTDLNELTFQGNTALHLAVRMSVRTHELGHLLLFPGNVCAGTQP
jgi:hypothetical protein